MPPIPVNRWPEHWHNSRDSIKCVVSGCNFTTDRPGWHSQWNDLQDHCEEGEGAEHVILLKMLWQNTCVIGDCAHPTFAGGPGSRVRNLFAHETEVHNSIKLSTISEFVKLARQEVIPGELGREAQKHAFDRLVEKVLLLSGSVLRELFERSGYRRRSQHTLEILKSILSSDHESLSGGYVPYSVPPQRFLWVARPNTNDPGDYEWLLVWRGLRADYKDGVM